ncbi:MAG: phytanoyl-CoA dioxygenase family protein, partial [Chloroflexi bacterium]|nr:phytanoyl-CoA dioxygenase family protein [Chloroflexota bacterium]
MNGPLIEEQVKQFHRDGFIVVEDAIEPGLLARVREGVERAFAEPDEESVLYGMPDMWRPKMFERGEPFEELVDNPRIIDLVEAILGADCHLIAMSALRTTPGAGISHWHADESVRFPRPPDVPLDPRIPAPCFVANFNYYLCDVDENLGPTQLVPGSHRSGRMPAADDRDANGDPFYEGRGPVKAVGPAGTAVLWHDQTWHRGAVNESRNEIRWVQQAPYGRRY